MKSWVEWIKSIFSEPNGNGSSSRVQGTAIIAFILGMGLAFGVNTMRHKITMEQFNSYLVAGGEFILTTAGPIYGINKAADWLKNKDKTGEQ